MTEANIYDKQLTSVIVSPGEQFDLYKEQLCRESSYSDCSRHLQTSPPEQSCTALKQVIEGVQGVFCHVISIGTGTKFSIFPQ